MNLELVLKSKSVEELIVLIDEIQKFKKTGLILNCDEFLHICRSFAKSVKQEPSMFYRLVQNQILLEVATRYRREHG